MQSASESPLPPSYPSKSHAYFLCTTLVRGANLKHCKKPITTTSEGKLRKQAPYTGTTSKQIIKCKIKS